MGIICTSQTLCVSMCAIYAAPLTPQTTPTDRHIWQSHGFDMHFGHLEPGCENQATNIPSCDQQLELLLCEMHDVPLGPSSCRGGSPLIYMNYSSTSGKPFVLQTGRTNFHPAGPLPSTSIKVHWSVPASTEGSCSGAQPPPFLTLLGDPAARPAASPLCVREDASLEVLGFACFHAGGIATSFLLRSAGAPRWNCHRDPSKVYHHSFICEKADAANTPHLLQMLHLFAA